MVVQAMTSYLGAVHTQLRPTRRDWIAGLLAGSALGLVFLGIGSRAGMRLIAISAGQAPSFSIEGSIAVSLLGAATGALVATIFLLARTVFPTRRWVRGALFWLVVAAIVLRGLNPVTSTNAAIFLPLFAAHGVLLQVFWCRFYLARREAIA